MWMSLLVSMGVLVGTILLYGIAMALIVQWVVRLVQHGYTGRVFWKNLIVMTTVLMVTVAAHLIQITVWGGVLFMVGETLTFEKAFYFSAENYTALGYGDILLSERWRLLGPMEAINGLLLFGVSTALMFAIMNSLITMRLRVQVDHLSDATPKQRLVSAAGER
jgi:hypothetical protein